MKNKKESGKQCYCCDVCGKEHGLDDLKDIEIKGKTRKICKECVTAIKGIA